MRTMWCVKGDILLFLRVIERFKARLDAAYKSYNKITQFVARNFPQLQKQLR